MPLINLICFLIFKVISNSKFSKFSRFMVRDYMHDEEYDVV